MVSNGVTEPGKVKNNSSTLSWLADVPIKNVDKIINDDSSSSDSESGENYSTLRELLIRPSNKPGSGENSPTNGTSQVKKSRLDILDDVISSLKENKDEENEVEMDVKGFELKHFVRRYHRINSAGKDKLPIRLMTLLESKVLYPDTPHSWLCDGKLLRLLDPMHSGNYRIFQVCIENYKIYLIHILRGKNIKLIRKETKNKLKYLVSRNYEFLLLSRLQ